MKEKAGHAAQDERTPSPPSHRRPALRAYIQGEAALDAGNLAAGVDSMKLAYSLAWELDCEPWPKWANELHFHMVNGCRPTLLAEDETVLPTRLQSACIRSPESSLAAISASLETHHFAIVDGFLGADASCLRASCTAACSSMQPARRAGTPGAAGRGDWIVWEPEGFDLLTRRTDALIHGLRSGCKADGMSRITCRQRPMVSCYSKGARFARHVDNHVGTDKENGRVLTAVYYMQAKGEWDAEADGGCLRIFRPEQPPTSSHVRPTPDQQRPGDGDGEGDGDDNDGSTIDELLEVAPIADRLVLFFSNHRCPHEVLPVSADGAFRLAATIWYWEHEEVPSWWVDGIHDCTLVPVQTSSKAVPLLEREPPMEPPPSVLVS